MLVAHALQDGVEQTSSVILPAQSSRLPLLPGAGQSRNSHHALHTRLVSLPQRSVLALQFGQGLLWLNHANQGVQGVGISVLPLRQASQRLTINGVYINQGAGANGGGHNRAWSLAVTSRWLGERLTLHGEYARSRTNVGAWDSRLEQRSGQAYALSASYSDQSHIFGREPLSWGLSVDWQRASPAFWSPTAGSVAPGKATTQATANIHWGGLGARLSYSRATTNVAGDPKVPTLSTNTLTVDLHYTEQQPIVSSGLGWLFAAPRYALHLKHESHRVEQASASDSANIPDRYQDTISLKAHFTPGPWWWEVSYTYSRRRVHGAEPAAVDSKRARLKLYLPLSDWLELTPTLHWGLTERQGPDSEIRVLTGALSGTASLIPNRLVAELNVRAQRRSSSHEGVETQTVAVRVGSALSWTFRPSQVGRPRITISLRGSTRYADSSFNSSSLGSVLSWTFRPSQAGRPRITISLRGSTRYADSSFNSSSVRSTLSWTFRPSQAGRPKITISLRGSARYADSSLNSPSVQYQAFAGIEVSWPGTN